MAEGSWTIKRGYGIQQGLRIALHQERRNSESEHGSSDEDGSWNSDVVELTARPVIGRHHEVE